MEKLPPELMHRVMDELALMHLLQLMSTCRSLYGTGRADHRWTSLRLSRELPPPKPKAQKLKTDYDIVQNFMRHACGLCLRRPRGIHGVCRDCRAHNRCWSDLTFVRSSHTATSRYIDTLSGMLETSRASLTILTSRLERAEQIMRGQRVRALWSLQ